MSSRDVDRQAEKQSETRTELEARAKRLFDESVERLDATTRSRLTQARFRALEQATRAGPQDASARRFGPSAFWLPAGALAASALVAWLVWRPAQQAELPVAPLALNDLEILLAEEDIALLEELEFFDWLAQQPEFAAPDGANGVG